MKAPPSKAPLTDLVRLGEASFFGRYPFDVFARMRAEAPVYWSEVDQAWALTKYEDIRFVSRSPHLFANRFGLTASQCRVADDGEPPADDPIDGGPMPRRAALRAIGGGMEDVLVLTDPPRHGFLRKLASHAFTPKAIALLEAHVADLARSLLDQIEPGVQVDFVDTVAAPVPMRVIAEMLGVSTDRLDDFRRWSDAFIELNDQNEGRTEADTNLHVQAVLEFQEYFRSELEHRAENPHEDLLGRLAQAREDDGTPLRIDSQLAMTFVLLTAGNETTRGLLSNAAKLLHDHPDQRQLLAEDPTLLPNAVEELLRFQSPVTHMCRTALADTEIRGRKIARGDYLVMIYPAANHDEDIWERADEFDVTRRPEPGHLAFGFAEHFCLGASLARREIRLVLAELLKRYPNYELVGEPVRVTADMTPGYKTMPVIFHP
jgi:cytochrome P450